MAQFYPIAASGDRAPVSASLYWQRWLRELEVGSTLSRMAAVLTEGDMDRGAPPDLARLRVVAQLSPHLPHTDPLWPAVLDWAVRYDAAGTFVRHLQEAQRMRGVGRLTDADTMASWAWERAQREVRR